MQGPGSVKHSIGIDRFAKQLRYDSISFIPAVNLNNSTATAPVTNSSLTVLYASCSAPARQPKLAKSSSRERYSVMCPLTSSNRLPTGLPSSVVSYTNPPSGTV